MTTRAALAALLMACVLLPSAFASPSRKNASPRLLKSPGRVRATDDAPPVVTITTPTALPAFASRMARLVLAGTASDDVAVASVTWSSDRGSSGTCSGTSAWTATGIPLVSGVNVITITAKDTANKTATDTVTVTVDNAPPTIAFTSPTTGENYETLEESISLAGTASDESGIANVYWWCCSEWGCLNGDCDGTTEWSADEILLSGGVNEITVGAIDLAGNISYATLIVTLADAVAPEIYITNPPTGMAYATQDAYIEISGVCSDNSDYCPYVTWSSDRGYCGDAYVYYDGSWQTYEMRLAPGHNLITVTATDTYGNTASDSLDVLFTDASAPCISLYSYDYEVIVNCPEVGASGYAYDDAEVTLVYWWNELGDSGICEGTAEWSAAGIPLHEGTNVVTFAAADSSGNAASVDLIVTYVPSSPGDAWKGLSLVSLPIIPKQADPKPIVGFQEYKWATYMPYNSSYASYPASESWFYQSDDDPKRAFWACFDGPPETPCGTALRQDQPISIYLYTGWNLIGEPFVTGTQWDLDRIQVDTGYEVLSLRDASGYCSSYAWGWDNIAGGYYLVADPSEVLGAMNHLEPWRGYWLKAKASCTLILPAWGGAM